MSTETIRLSKAGIYVYGLIGSVDSTGRTNGTHELKREEEDPATRSMTFRPSPAKNCVFQEIGMEKLIVSHVYTTAFDDGIGGKYPCFPDSCGCVLLKCR